MRQRLVRWTTILMIALTSFLLGLGLARLQNMPSLSVWWLIVGLLGILVLLRRPNKRYIFVVLILLAGLLGWWRGSVYMERLSMYQSLYGKDVTLQVTALEDGIYNDKGQLTFTADKLKVGRPQEYRLVGQIEVSGFGATAVYRGDIIQAQGQLFPKRGANQAGMSFAALSVVSRSDSVVDKVRRQFAVGLQNALPEPLASFALGLLIGQRNTLGQALNDELITVGLIHIVAVSGYNLTVLTHASQKLFAKRSRYQSLVFSLLLIGLFLLLTGSSPSIVRAALVSILGLFTWYFGRRVRPVLLLLIAAAITAGINPLYLWSNIGWYLSFTAFFGVLVLAPLLQQKFLSTGLRERLLPTVLFETTAAQLCTLPIILFIFGRLSIISIIANLLVVPVVPFAMIFSLLAGVSGMMSWGLTGLVALPAKLLLEYILSIAGALAKVPYANVAFEISALQMVSLYALILSITALLYRKSLQRRDTISPENKE